MRESESIPEPYVGSIVSFPVPGRDRTSELPSKTLFSAGLDVKGNVHWEPPRWETPSIEKVAQLLPEFEILAFVGRGGMGAVYKAWLPRLNDTVAIKLLPLEVSADAGFRRRFLREAETLSQLKHPRIVALHEMGTTQDDHLYLVMELVEGTSVAEMIRTGDMQPSQVRAIMSDVCDALSHAHACDVVHRDINPANVLVDTEGRAKVLDFGVARWNPPNIHKLVETTNAIFGTRAYIAPEQLRSSTVDHRADIYSMGVMLYEMLCGELPLGRFDLPSARMGADPRFDDIIVRAMQPNPEARYPDAEAMRKEIVATGIAVAVVPPTGKPVEQVIMPKAKIALLAGAFLAVVIAIVFFATRAPSWKPARLTPAPAPSHSPISAQTLVQAPAPAPIPIATATTPPPISEVWHNWPSEQNALPAGVSKTASGYLIDMPKGAEPFAISPVLADQSIRVRLAKPASRQPYFRLLVRGSATADTSYRGVIQNKLWQLTIHDPEKGDRAFSVLNAPASYAAGGEHAIELRARRKTISLLLDGDVICEKQNSAYAEGRACFSADGPLEVLSLEWASLEPVVESVVKR